jgi:hypothetical protein
VLNELDTADRKQRHPPEDHRRRSARFSDEPGDVCCSRVRRPRRPESHCSRHSA